MDTCGVIDTLHQKGFTDDFVFHGNDILWVQKKIYLNPDKLTLVEYHRFDDAKGKEAIVFGVIAPYYGIMGVLIKHFDDYNSNCMAVIQNRMDELFTFAE